MANKTLLLVLGCLLLSGLLVDARDVSLQEHKRKARRLAQTDTTLTDQQLQDALNDPALQDAINQALSDPALQDPAIQQALDQALADAAAQDGGGGGSGGGITYPKFKMECKHNVCVAGSGAIGLLITGLIVGGVLIGVLIMKAFSSKVHPA